MNIFGYTLALYYAWNNFLRWYFHVGIITNQRAIDIDFPSTLFKSVTIAELRDVQEVTTKAVGYIGAVFNFGDIFIQTAGTRANIEFHNAPQPSQIVKVINELSQQNYVSR
jgi:membrane protein YdbS with pleckstrin-like domain